MANFAHIIQLRPYLVDRTGSRSISKVKLRRALLILRLETTWEHGGAVVFYPVRTIFLQKSIFCDNPFFASSFRSLSIRIVPPLKKGDVAKLLSRGLIGVLSQMRVRVN